MSETTKKFIVVATIEVLASDAKTAFDKFSSSTLEIPEGALSFSVSVDEAK